MYEMCAKIVILGEVGSYLLCAIYLQGSGDEMLHI